MRILALDVATKTGWCVDHKIHGVWNFKLKRGESYGMKLLRFSTRIKEVCELYKIDLLVMERPSGRNTHAIIHQSEMIGVAKQYCEEIGIDYSEYSASEIKKFATGKGNANKKMMIDSARELGYRLEDDNEADAIHLWRMVQEGV